MYQSKDLASSLIFDRLGSFSARHPEPTRGVPEAERARPARNWRLAPGYDVLESAPNN